MGAYATDKVLNVFLFTNCVSEQQNIFYLRESARSAAKGLLIGEGFTPKVKIEKDLNSAELLYRGAQKEDIAKIEVRRSKLNVSLSLVTSLAGCGEHNNSKIYNFSKFILS